MLLSHRSLQQPPFQSIYYMLLLIILQLGMTSLLQLLLYYLIWRVFFSYFVQYFWLCRAYGFRRVGLIYKPFADMRQVIDPSSNLRSGGRAFYQRMLERYPDIKIIVVMTLGLNALLVVDPVLLRKLMNDNIRKITKRGMLIFRNELQKGLFFSQGEAWKISRSTISNLFHFDMIKNRESVMERTIEKHIEGLDQGNPNIFTFGCRIGGEIVMKSLFGYRFLQIWFEDNNPHEELSEILTGLSNETNSIMYSLRCLLFGRVESTSRFLSASQRKLLNRLLRFKASSKQYVLEQKQRYLQGESVAPFLQTFFKLENSDDYLEEIVQHLLVFLVGGEHTTASLIEVVLAQLAIHPEYQQEILIETASHGVHNSKALNNFISECNRVTAPIQLSPLRKVIEPFNVDGFTFKKDTIMLFSYGAVMVNPKYWDDPKTFDPSRFNKANPGNYFPFSMGPRNCIGQHMALMQIRLTIVKLLQKYEIVQKGKDQTLQTKFGGLVNPLIDSHFVEFRRR